MLKEFLFTIWFFLPAGAANVMPILVAAIPQLRRFDAPIDCHLTFRGKRILGDHKTWRGLISGILAATLAFWLQQVLVAHVGWIANISDTANYALLPTLIVGPLFGLGALGGDAIESFFKRQRGVAPGRGWFPFDQTDYIIGGALATAPYIHLGVGQYCMLIVTWLIVHVIASYIGYLAGLKERPI